MRKLLAEFFGTYWLVFGGCGSALFAAGIPDLGIVLPEEILEKVVEEVDGLAGADPSVIFFFSIEEVKSSLLDFLSPCAVDFDGSTDLGVESPEEPLVAFKLNSASVGGKQRSSLHVMKLTAPVIGLEGSITFIFCSMV